ncbi:peptidase U32 family protein [Desulfotruncus alcoholivorax]|uniref:peptidase U32 family protein n=1 Tax=Desulfotruncus alcoholivorax TaxID=265477 RepID=UPI000429CB92|nr:U32 family peptidase [Desulfotruncus alcoholivorax]
MKILAPVASASEAKALIAMGASELYCGIQLNNWQRKFGTNVWMNRRGNKNANIQSLNELIRLITVAHEKNVPVFLVLNMPFYSSDQHVVILSLIEDILEHCPLDALIIGDPGLIIAIKKAFPKMEIHASSLAPVLNSASASFYNNLGASRIIFPRYIDLPDLKNIINKIDKKIETEVFILNDGCVFEEGFCNVSHALGGALCHNPLQFYTLVQKQNSRHVNSKKQPFSQHLQNYRKWLWHVRNCNGGSDPKGYPLGMCGLCAIPELINMGVTSLKIVGREASLSKKILSAKLVRKVLDYVESCDKDEISVAKIRSIRGTPKQCSNGYMCYFR